MPKYWLISSRNNNATGTDRNPDGPTYWVSDGDPANPAWCTDINNWRNVTPDNFQTLLIGAADGFPNPVGILPEQQSHVTLLIHGFNVSFADAATFYTNLYSQLYDGNAGGPRAGAANGAIPFSLNGICVLYDWPSLGEVTGYLPDRSEACACAADLADVLSELYDWLLLKQQDAVDDPPNPCKAKVSVIAHSMGNYVLQKAMATAWTRKNQPLLVSLINQLLMVAADVDNDLFDAGAADNSDGEAVLNLTYRICALYSGRDAVLGASAGLKHFGTRRLGRSGLANLPPLVSAPPQTDNVWEADCSSFFPAAVNGIQIHSAYFQTPETIQLMRQILCGVDRDVLQTLGYTQGKAWPPKA